jgi:hypothetical protein
MDSRKMLRTLERQRKRKQVPESAYITTMHNKANTVEFDDLQAGFFTDEKFTGLELSISRNKTLLTYYGEHLRSYLIVFT